MSVQDKISWKAKWTINKFKDQRGEIGRQLKAGAKIEDVKEKFPEAFIAKETIEGNVALNEGLQALIELAGGISTPNKWDNTNAYLGVGDSSTAPVATQTGLLAAVNKFWEPLDATYPQRTGQVCEWRATFEDGDAEFAWEEYTVVNASDDTGDNLNRCIASKGTKASGEAWTLALQITFS
jgi:hypothetical protein